MGDNAKIEWTDFTWNVITGCSVKSAGCKNCYAMKLAGTRLQHHPSRTGLTTETSNGPVWNGEVRFNHAWLDQPLRLKRPRKIFVCAHSDLFHESVPDEWIDRVFAVMALSPQHVFQVLTKRADRMDNYLSDPDVGVRVGKAEAEFAKQTSFYKAKNGVANVHLGCRRVMPLPNVCVGVSVEDQKAADERIPLLLQTPAAVRWVSAEPLLGSIDLQRAHMTRKKLANFPDKTRVDWVVVGGESGAKARPMHPNWARSLRDQCDATGIPFLFKQWGEWAPRAGLLTGGGTDFSEIDPSCTLWKNVIRLGEHGYDTRISENCTDEMGEEIFMQMVGKKLAGRLLDGVQHDGYPKQSADPLL
jgi:protein gp37